MKRYAPCIPEEAAPGSMCERADGEYYLASGVDARIAELEHELRACRDVLQKASKQVYNDVSVAVSIRLQALERVL